MKESRFVELVNLYIDRQITPEETAQLEAEIVASTNRRRIYRQYCQMHRASRQVHENFRAQAAGSESGAGGGSTGAIARFEVERRRRRGVRWTYYAAGLAAAACLTFVVVRFATHRGNPTPPALLTDNTPATAPVVERAPEQMVAVAANPPPVSEVRPGLVSLRNGFAFGPDYSSRVIILRPDDQVFDTVSGPAPRAQSLFKDGAFEELSRTTNQQVYQGRDFLRQHTEFTGFQFQR